MANEIDSIFDFSPKALGELKAWMEPWWQRDEGTRGTTEVSGPTFSEGIFTLGATSDLLGYWRLGESASPFADSNPYLTPVDQVKIENGADYTTHVTGALVPSQDDGAIQFNGLYYTPTPGDYLGATPGDGRYDLSHHDFSVLCWVNPTADAAAAVGGIVGSNYVGVFSQAGWWLDVLWPALTLSFKMWFDGGPFTTLTTTLASDTWSFIAATFNNTDGLCLYVNGALVDSDPTTSGITLTGAGVNIGAIIGKISPGGIDTSIPFTFKGEIDEVSLWGSTLTETQIMQLYIQGLAFHGGSHSVELDVGESFIIFDHSGAPIFRVDEDGSVHVVTGSSVIDDL